MTTLPDCSGLIGSSYGGGSISFVPLLDGRFGNATTLAFNHTQANGTAAPQDQSRAHASLIHGGRIYTADLGNDRVWVSHVANGTLSLEGAIKTSPGFGPRHMVLVPGPNVTSSDGAANGTEPCGNGTSADADADADGGVLVVVGELANAVAAFDVAAPDAPLFNASVVPPGLNATGMAAGEIALNPRNRSEVFVSNRLAAKSNPGVGGDSIAILTLAPDARSVVGTRFINTTLFNIRGMRFSPDGEFLALAGIERGIAVYKEDGKGEWAQVAKYDNITQAADFAWIEGDTYAASNTTAEQGQ